MRADAERVGARARHRQRIGVLEAEPAEHRDAVLVGEPLADLGQHLGARLDVGALHLVGPDRAGIIDVDVDLAGARAR